MLHTTSVPATIRPTETEADMPPEPSRHSCRICGNPDGNAAYHVREMLYGTREPFEYFECAECGCLQISQVPDDLGRYYPRDYLSFKDYHRRTRNRLRKYVDTARVGYALTGRGLFGRLAHCLLPALDYVHWCRVAGIDRDSRILDLGCGAGKLLIRMMQGGFRHLEGADPFIDADIQYPGVSIHRMGLDELVAQRAGDFDLVMMHHSFEHMDGPVAVLRQVRELLASGGTLLIRIPMADSYAWEHYRENWVQLDPPRHLYLHTQASMARVAADAGMEVFATEYDSTETQFTESELYCRNIPGNAPRQERNLFSTEERKAFAAKAEVLNRQGRGDQGAFYFRRRRSESKAA